MINFYTVSAYCKDDISLIENYEAANNDTTQTWDCHHRRETDLRLSANELKEQDKYFNVPASELIFLTPSEHTKIHMQGENHPLYGKSPSEETREKNRQSHLGKEPWNKGKRGVQQAWNKGMTKEEMKNYKIK